MAAHELIFEATVPYEGSSLTVRARTRPYPQWRNGYMSPTRTEWNKSTQIYVHEKGETLIENLINRQRRPIDVYRDAAYAALKLFPELEGYRLRWSQNAGCSMCPCSPGFLLKDPSLHAAVHHMDGRRVDFWVDIDRTTPYVDQDVQDAIAARIMAGQAVQL